MQVRCLASAGGLQSNHPLELFKRLRSTKSEDCSCCNPKVWQHLLWVILLVVIRLAAHRERLQAPVPAADWQTGWLPHRRCSQSGWPLRPHPCSLHKHKAQVKCIKFVIDLLLLATVRIIVGLVLEFVRVRHLVLRSTQRRRREHSPFQSQCADGCYEFNVALPTLINRAACEQEAIDECEINGTSWAGGSADPGGVLDGFGANLPFFPPTPNLRSGPRRQAKEAASGELGRCCMLGSMDASTYVLKLRC